jgi:class 3 adenylate cyclase
MTARSSILDILRRTKTMPIAPSAPLSNLLTTIRALRPIPDVDLHARIGVATGLVVVSDLLARAEVRERYAVGETMNLAARLQAIAEPDTIVIDHRTKQLVGDLFVYQRSRTNKSQGHPRTCSSVAGVNAQPDRRPF